MLTDEKVKFGFDTSDLSPEAQAAIDEFAGKIKEQNQNVYIEIQGHTDNVGSVKYNEELGLLRAESVRRYLNQKHELPAAPHQRHLLRRDRAGGGQQLPPGPLAEPPRRAGGVAVGSREDGQDAGDCKELLAFFQSLASSIRSASHSGIGTDRSPCGPSSSQQAQVVRPLDTGSPSRVISKP